MRISEFKFHNWYRFLQFQSGTSVSLSYLKYIFGSMKLFSTGCFIEYLIDHLFTTDVQFRQLLPVCKAKRIIS